MLVEIAFLWYNYLVRLLAKRSSDLPDTRLETILQTHGGPRWHLKINLASPIPPSLPSRRSASAKKAVELFDSSALDKLAPGRFTSLQAIHKALFEDIHDFAGELPVWNLVAQKRRLNRPPFGVGDVIKSDKRNRPRLVSALWQLRLYYIDISGRQLYLYG